MGALGLVSHFTKDALASIAQQSLSDGLLEPEQRSRVESALATKSFNHLAMELGVKVIHVAERDTQITDRPKEVDEFCNAYCPADVAIASLHELRMRHLVMQERQRILNDEILPGGADAMGILLMGHPYRSWWTGSILTIDEARALVPAQNATTLQVAASVMAATVWMIENPERGVLLPDDLDYDRILELARPYLGTYHSAAADWGPLDNRTESSLFSRYTQPTINADDSDEEWQFKTFLV